MTKQAGDDARVEEMILAACLGAASAGEFERDLRAFLASQGLGSDDVDAITSSPPRLALYRRLIRNNLTGVTEKMLGRTRARLNARVAGAFDASFSEFLQEVGPRTHYLRDVPSEFLAWAEPRWRVQAGWPAWIVDFARHELVEFQIAAARAPREPPDAVEVALDRGLLFGEPVSLLRYAYRVHELPADIDDRTEPAAGATVLLGYRDADHAAAFLELTPLAAQIAERLLSGAPLGVALREATAAMGASVEVLDVAKLLADFGARGILLGGRP